MGKKKTILVILGVLLLVAVALGIVAFFFWPWKSLSGEIQKALGGSGKLWVVSVEKSSLTSNETQNKISLDASSLEATRIVAEIENTKVMYLRNEMGMATFGTAYSVDLRTVGKDSVISVSVKDNGEVHLSIVGKTYRITSKDSNLYELLRQTYQSKAKGAA